VRWFGLRGYARFDARVDEQGKLRVIDVNPNPDISPGAGVSRAVARRGIELGDFVRGQAALAWARARAAAP
jgi:D-alanine-D-alanine ligase